MFPSYNEESKTNTFAQQRVMREVLGAKTASKSTFTRLQTRLLTLIVREHDLLCLVHAHHQDTVPVLVYIHGGGKSFETFYMGTILIMTFHTGYVFGNPRNWPFDHWVNQSPVRHSREFHPCLSCVN
jgi:hypothetical protein